LMSILKAVLLSSVTFSDAHTDWNFALG
jgi:hypothetical protein